MPTCTFLVGIPASGKSTWVKKHAKFEVVLSTDDLLEDFATLENITYNDAFTKYMPRADKMFHDILDSCARTGDDVIIDRTNLSKKSRKRLMEKFKDKGYVFKAVVFPVPNQEELSTRLASRPGKTIPQKVMWSMISNFQHPTVDEGFSEVAVYA